MCLRLEASGEIEMIKEELRKESARVDARIPLPAEAGRPVDGDARRSEAPDPSVLTAIR